MSKLKYSCRQMSWKWICFRHWLERQMWDNYIYVPLCISIYIFVNISIHKYQEIYNENLESLRLKKFFWKLYYIALVNYAALMALRIIWWNGLILFNKLEWSPFILHLINREDILQQFPCESEYPNLKLKPNKVATASSNHRIIHSVWQT